jgi:RNA polymerase sigma-70 factor (ECF subfamily)
MSLGGARRLPLRAMATVSTTRLEEQALLEAARRGDEDAFHRIVAPHRTALHAHCYRMLGSIHDAEDALQETLLSAWRGLPGLERQGSARPWLYRIATNVCLDAIARRPKRMLPVDHGPATAPTNDPGEPLVESVWVEPYPDDALGLDGGYAAPEARYEQREAVELAFIAALQHLPARQRAVLILREVLGFSAREVSESLETTVASVNSALQRARKAVEERLPERSQQATLRALGDERIRELVEAYVDAWRRGDVEALRALLAEDALFSMPPWAAWWRGRDTIAAFAKTAVEVCAVSRTVPTRANGQPAVAYYSLDAETGRYLAGAIDVITLEGSLIKEITAFVNPEAFRHFGLPPELEPQA